MQRSWLVNSKFIFQPYSNLYKELMVASNEALLEAFRITKIRLANQYLEAGVPLVIQPDRTRLQWIMPQRDGTFKLVREELIKPA